MRHRMIAVFSALVVGSVAPAAFALTFTLDGGGPSSALARHAAGSASDLGILPSLPGVGSVAATDAILSKVGYDTAFADVRGAAVPAPVSSASAISFRPITDLELLAVPEPSTGLLLVSGLALLAAARRRRSD